MPLSPTDQVHINTAAGLLQIGEASDAWSELEMNTAPSRPLEVRGFRHKIRGNKDERNATQIADGVQSAEIFAPGIPKVDDVAIGVGPGHGVQKDRILFDSHFVFADPIRVADGTITRSIVVAVAGVLNRNGVDRD